MPTDLTAILLPAPPRGPNPNQIVKIVSENAPPVVWLRLVPLQRLGLTQLEVLEGDTGLPAVSPKLVEALAAAGGEDGKALFVHTNQDAKQALLHAFEGSATVASYNGVPSEEFAGEVQRLTGSSIEELVAADDGSRGGFGRAASRTAILQRGRVFLVPAGTPTGMGSFRFHDRGHGIDQPPSEGPAEEGAPAAAPEGDQQADADDTEGARVAFFAFDLELIKQAWNEMPGAELAKVIASAPPAVLGPLSGLRDETARVLAALPTPPGQQAEQPVEHVRAFEMLALAHAAVFGGGDALGYVDGRLLPFLAIGDAAPIIDDDDEARELEDMGSVLQAMVEVLPYPKPPGGYGQLLEMVSDAELDALAPWARAGEEYHGAIFRVNPERLLEQVRALDGGKLALRLESFFKVLFEARHGQPAPAADNVYAAWRNAIEDRSQPDIERLLTDWAELRLVLEIAALNKLAVGLIIYGE